MSRIAPRPLVSMVFCTFNRCEGMQDTIKALIRQNVPQEVSVEIVIVDNNSVDETKDVVMRYAEASTIPIRYLFESRQGKSFALNTAIKESFGETLFFTDDDVVPEQNWLLSLFNTMKKLNADCAGGKIHPLWLDEPPDWLKGRGNHVGFFGILDHGDEQIIADTSANSTFLFGGNTAIRKSVFNDVGLYRTDLGRRGNELSGGEETELMKRMMKAGKKIVYVPEAVVRHKIAKDRMTLQFVRKLKFQSGRSIARMRTSRTGVPRWLVRECLEAGLNALWSYVKGAQESAIRCEEEFWTKLGMIVETFSLKSGRKGTV